MMEQLNMLASSLQGADPLVLLPALEMVLRIANSILNDPANPKVRSIKAKGAAFQKVAAFESLLQLLSVGGFEFGGRNEDGEEVVRFPSRASLHDLAEMRSVVEAHARPLRPQAGAAGAAEGAAEGAAVERETRVFRKSETGVDPARFSVPESFFAAKASDFAPSAAAKAQKEYMMTKQMREALKPKHRFALIRVRFPDGFVIQGKFKPSEPVSAVKAWVQGCLSLPDRLFYLSTMPPVQRVTEGKLGGQSLAELDLSPACLLNFWWSDGINDVGAGIPPMITPALVARAETLCTEAMPEAEKGRTWVDNVAKASAVGACLLASFLFGVECCSRLV